MKIYLINHDNAFWQYAVGENNAKKAFAVALKAYLYRNGIRLSECAKHDDNERSYEQCCEEMKFDKVLYYHLYAKEIGAAPLED